MKTFLLTLFLLISTQAFAAQEALRDLEPLSIVVKPLDADAKKAKLSEVKIRESLQKKLASSGITVSENEGEPVLEVSVLVLRHYPSRTASYRLVLRDWVASRKDPKTKFLATVWEKSGVLSASNWKLETRLNEGLASLTDVLIRDYVESNPTAYQDQQDTN